MMLEKIWETQELDDELLKEIEIFAERRYKKSKKTLMKRNQVSKTEINRQDCCGKMGEWVAYYALNPLFPDLTEPDMQIYEPGDTTWNADLREEQFVFPVKSYSVHTPMKPSWVFQYENADGFKGRDVEIFDEPYASDPNRLITFVEVDPFEKQGRVIAIIPLPKLHKYNLFEEMQKKMLVGKRAVYLHSLRIVENFYGEKLLKTPPDAFQNNDCRLH